ncbi:MAG: aminomethyl-transferring glycine dehydrogenase [bacterium]
MTHPLALTDSFVRRHVGPSDAEVSEMLAELGFSTLEELITKTIPNDIRVKKPLNLPTPLAEVEALEALRVIAAKNQEFRSFIGMGYNACITPGVIQRNILENPGWYTQYTPYQAEIAQGRLEALFNFQTLVAELTGLEIANASLLDEATAAAEAMALAHRANRKSKSNMFFAASNCHPQTLAVLETRAKYLGVELTIGDWESFDFEATPVFGVLLQYPSTYGRLLTYDDFTAQAHAHNAIVTVASDLMALVAVRPPSEFGADIVVGSTQRFGVPLGFGGPHAAYMACKDEFKRQIPGRIVGQSVTVDGKPAWRLALQTREQHIRREKATSNICTAQVLLAVIASMYACYHGPEGLKAIALRIHRLADSLAASLKALGHTVDETPTFDTVRVLDVDTATVVSKLAAKRMNARVSEGTVLFALDEATTIEDLHNILEVFGGKPSDLVVSQATEVAGFARTGSFLTQECFNLYHSESELLRYMKRLESRDLSLTTSMIPLGSCTMKLNATAEMFPVTWKEFGQVHPYAPAEQTQGYAAMFADLETWLSEITGMDATSLQPNAGSQGEYAGMLAIRRYHEAQGQSQRTICLIPDSAHGTNPASAIMAGMEVVVVKCDERGNVDMADLATKAAAHADKLAAVMVTYPSTHGVFEREISRLCEVVHAHGGQVYLDGANMNAQVALCRPGDFGADVCHLNLHKTFCIPHGGGGPGMGPICVKAHLAPHVPGNPMERHSGAVSAAPYGSPSILPIPWMYIRMLGAEGLKHATEVAILNANYMAHRLQEHFPILYRGDEGQVAHEFILDMRGLKASGIEVVDIAKRLMDYGFHAPTMSWPVAGTIMVEPTESESKMELDRLVEAFIGIKGEVDAIDAGTYPRDNNPLKNAPHPAYVVMASEWTHSYSREVAAYPAKWTTEHKYWPPVRRIDDAYGDRNLVCACPPMSAYE